MNLNTINTYGGSQERAFEGLCNQLFQNWLAREFPNDGFRINVVNGAGGDGGVEAYATSYNGTVVAVQSKWFPTALTNSQINQIKKSVRTAKDVRPELTQYVVCISRNLTDKKKGQGGKLVVNMDRNKIDSLKKELKATYPDLVVEEWDEHDIVTELQQPNNGGVLKFWFDREEISMVALSDRFAVAKHGWLKERYISSLHAKGFIDEQLHQLLYTEDYRSVLDQELLQFKNELKTSQSILISFKKVIGKILFLTDSLKEAIQTLGDNLLAIEGISSKISQGEIFKSPASFNKVKVDELLGLLSKAVFGDKMIDNLQEKVFRTLRRLKELYRQDIFDRLANEVAPRNRMFLGMAGTGQTPGIANFVEARIKEGYPTLIINAKISSTASWESILKEAIGGLSSWSENEIFEGLTSSAIRKDVGRRYTVVPKDTFIHPELSRVLICVDGLDESVVGKWIDRINETAYLIERFPRIRFAFTCRHHAPDRNEQFKLKLDQRIRRLSLPEYGDVPIASLIPVYFEHYSISLENAPWIQRSITDAFTLKLFSEEYQGINLATTTRPVSFGVVTLIKSRLIRIETEFLQQHQSWSPSERGIQQIVLIIIGLFNNNPRIAHNELATAIVEKMRGLLTRTIAGLVLDNLVSNGILGKDEVENQHELTPPVVFYELTFQSYLDFTIANDAVNDIARTQNKDVPPALIDSGYNILKLAGIILFHDHHIMVGDNGYWSDLVDDLPYLKYDILTDSSSEKVRNYLPSILKEFLSSSRSRNSVLQEFVLKNLFRRDLNVARLFIHEPLSNFNSTFERDRFWSSPDAYGDKTIPHVGIILGEVSLEKTDRYDGLPLIKAWSLSSLSNVYRQQCLREFSYWAYHNVSEFIKLLDVMFQIRDPQIREDLSSLMLGLSSVFIVKGRGAKELAHWALKNVFAQQKLDENKNSVIRGACRAMVERAYLLKECTREELAMARPPYSSSDKLLELDFTTKDDDDGRDPITDDLAWYVVKEGYKGFLGNAGNEENYTAGKNLLKLYEGKYKRPIDGYSFAMAAGIAYLKKLGWKGEGHGSTKASGGTKSETFTYEEKYTWLAVHEMQGYFADLLPFHPEYNGAKKVPHYQLLTEIFNPCQKMRQEEGLPVSDFVDRWYVPQDLWPTIVYTSSNLSEKADKWIQSTVSPNFARWLSPDEVSLSLIEGNKNRWVTLYSYTDLHESSNICRAKLVSINAAVPKNQFRRFKKLFEGKPKGLHRDFNDYRHFLSKPTLESYGSVCDVTWMPWIKTTDERIILSSGDEVINLVSEVLEHSFETGESTPKFPSKRLLKGSKIIGTNGERFFDKNGDAKYVYYKSGNSNDDFQELLLCERGEFDNVLKKNGLVPIWIVQVHRTSSNLRHRRENTDYHNQNSKFWIVWKNGNRFESIRYHNEYFSNAEDVDNDDPDFVNGEDGVIDSDD